jgi:trans-aconitate methyltransferase
MGHEHESASRRVARVEIAGHSHADQTHEVADLWRVAADRSLQFDATALKYDKYRPRYPDALFDSIVELGELRPMASVIEIGAGTGIATEPLVDRGLQVTAIEPAPATAAIAVERLGGRAHVVVDRFENWSPGQQVQLVLACNAWHWIDPGAGLPLIRSLLPSGGSLAVVWTETIWWGEAPFEDCLTKALSAPWPKRLPSEVSTRESRTASE